MNKIIVKAEISSDVYKRLENATYLLQNRILSHFKEDCYENSFILENDLAAFFIRSFCIRHEGTELLESWDSEDVECFLLLANTENLKADEAKGSCITLSYELWDYIDRREMMMLVHMTDWNSSSLSKTINKILEEEIDHYSSLWEKQDAYSCLLL